MTVNDHSVDIRHSQIFQIAGGYCLYWSWYASKPPFEDAKFTIRTLDIFSVQFGNPHPKFYPSFSHLGRQRVKSSLLEMRRMRWLWRKATRLKWRRRQRYGYLCVAWWAASVGRFPLKKEDLKGIYSSLGDVFFWKKLPWSWNKHHKKWFWISTSSPKSGV